MAGASCWSGVIATTGTVRLGATPLGMANTGILLAAASASARSLG
ncbi:MAG TPA: hypothetical protein VFA76_16500 [Terriglobales bacterium]|nr:hypothetical protein [Terriglobales bacterium]